MGILKIIPHVRELMPMIFQRSIWNPTQGGEQIGHL